MDWWIDGWRGHQVMPLKRLWTNKKDGKVIPSDSSVVTMMFRHCLKLDSEQKATYRLSWFLADLSGGGLSLGSRWLSYLLLLLLLKRYRRLTRGRFAGRRLSHWLRSLAGLLAPSWALRWSRARWSLSCLLGGGADHRGRCGLLLNYWLCLWLDFSLGHWWHNCCCGLCSCCCGRLSHKDIRQNLLSLKRLHLQTILNNSRSQEQLWIFYENCVLLIQMVWV